MGLLDEAIREHLELKRRHGADPSEVARQENEALGPPRRGTVPAEEPVPAGEREPAEEAELADETELAEPEFEPAGAVGLDEVEEERPGAAIEEEPEPDAPEPSQPVGEPEAPVAPPAPAEQPTQRFDVEGAEEPEDPPPAADEAPPRRAEEAAPERRGADDVLEKTPDFLQETPEHDRLWFEQKPPRDFDF